MSPSTSLTRADLEALSISFATPSLGMQSSHTLESKLDAMRSAGYKFVTLGFGNFMAWVRTRQPDLPASTCPPEWIRDDEPAPSDEKIWEAMYSEAEFLKNHVKSLGMQLVVFQPISQFEGWHKGSKRYEFVRAKAEKWLPLCAILGVQYLQLGSNDQKDADAPYESLCEDMEWIAQLGSRQSPPIKISYEPWCFSHRIPSWEGCWDVVKKVDHPYLGLCIDIAHIALSPDYGGYNPLTGGGYTDSEFEDELSRIRAVPGDKIHFFEISDVIKPEPPLLKGSSFDDYHKSDPEARVLFTWSICGRCLPLVGKNAGKDVKSELDLGGARAVEIMKAVLNTGFRGPCSFEVFEQQYMNTSDSSVTRRYAEAGQLSKERMFKALLEM